MAVVSYDNISEDFDISDAQPNYVTEALNFNTFTTSWAWITLNGGVIRTEGTNLTYNGNSIVSGTITAVGVNVSGNPGILDGDFYASDLNIDASRLSTLIGSGLPFLQQNDLFWNTVLGGDDFINLGTGGFDINIGGDGVEVGSGGVRFGGSDNIFGSASGQVSGDFFDVRAGGIAYGGADVILRFGIGNDIFGDARDLQAGAVVVGGNDYIAADTSGIVLGDAFDVGEGAVLLGGDDILVSTRYLAGAILMGDAYNVDGNAQFYGGDDQLIGSSRSDQLFGDFFLIEPNANPAVMIGGNDTLIGGGGADRMWGDWVDDSIGIGGNDILSGGQGDDKLYGNGGNDILDGGDGSDSIDGGVGYDTLSYQSASVGIYADLRTDMSNRDASGSVDTISNVEAIQGSYFADVLVGDDASNTLSGLSSGDTIFGLGGNDYILGGYGSDVLYGGEGYDVYIHEASEFIAGEYDVIADFSESATSFDYMLFQGVASNSLIYAQSGSSLVISTNALAYSGGIVIENFTQAQLADQLLFT